MKDACGTGTSSERNVCFAVLLQSSEEESIRGAPLLPALFDFVTKAGNIFSSHHDIKP
jgi:hypothetical protein